MDVNGLRVTLSHFESLRVTSKKSKNVNRASQFRVSAQQVAFQFLSAVCCFRANRQKRFEGISFSHRAGFFRFWDFPPPTLFDVVRAGGKERKIPQREIFYINSVFVVAFHTRPSMDGLSGVRTVTTICLLMRSETTFGGTKRRRRNCGTILPPRPSLISCDKCFESIAIVKSEFVILLIRFSEFDFITFRYFFCNQQWFCADGSSCFLVLSFCSNV